MEWKINIGPGGNLMILMWRGPGRQPPQERYSLWTRVGSITRALADVCVGEYPVSVVSVLVSTPRWALMSLKLLTVALALVRSIIWEIWSQATRSRSIHPIGIYKLSWAPWESSRMSLTEAGIETNMVKTNRINIFNILLPILELGVTGGFIHLLHQLGSGNPEDLAYLPKLQFLHFKGRDNNSIQHAGLL